MRKYNKKWELLLSDKRFRKTDIPGHVDGRNPFENDYGRLIFSSEIRRLQDKTQVFPLERNDYIRTRLTHSLEVSYIGSSLGQSIEKWLIDDNKLLDESKRGYLPSLLRAAGLIHDLGNPPFGHFGELSIQKFFDHYLKNYDIQLSDQEKMDFKNFDGNAQTLRILSRLHYFGDDYGFNLTFSTLASVIKYPSNSLQGNKGKKYERIAEKKFGYFVSEEDKYTEINDYLKLNNNRSPIVYLVEAADDIAYSAADIEDGIKLNIIDLADVEQIFCTCLKGKQAIKVLNKLKQLKQDLGYPEPGEAAIVAQKFRVFTQQLMIEAVIEAFIDKYEEIMTGELQDELLNVSNAQDIRAAYKKLQKLIVNNVKIQKKELAGWEALNGLLGIFTKGLRVLDNKAEFEDDGLAKRLYNVISPNYRRVYEEVRQDLSPAYKRLQLIVDFIAGMTDSYAIDLYQELKGIKL